MKSNICDTRIRNVQSAEWQTNWLQHLFHLNQHLVLTAAVAACAALLQTSLKPVPEGPPSRKADTSQWIYNNFN